MLLVFGGCCFFLFSFFFFLFLFLFLWLVFFLLLFLVCLLWFVVAFVCWLLFLFSPWLQFWHIIIGNFSIFHKHGETDKTSPAAPPDQRLPSLCIQNNCKATWFTYPSICFYWLFAPMASIRWEFPTTRQTKCNRAQLEPMKTLIFSITSLQQSLPLVNTGR